ncbi:MAG: TIGR03618 family F420-dependent PPOX class oxidoreductase [Anaerolineales bacterium]
MVPESQQYLLKDETKAFAYVATAMSNGQPQLTCVWFNTDGEGHILFNTVDRAAKFRYLSKNPRVAILISDPQDPHKYVQIRGRVEMTKEGAVEHTHALSRKYTGKDFELRPGTLRVMYKVKPKRVTVWPPQR